MDSSRRAWAWASARTVRKPEEVANSRDNSRDREQHIHLLVVACHPLWEALEADRDRDKASLSAEGVHHSPEHGLGVEGVGVGVGYTKDTDSHKHRDSAEAPTVLALVVMGQLDKNYRN